jgi:hypothetical protein
MMSMRIVAALAALLLTSCGGGGGTACPPPLVGSCTNHTGLFCTEYAGVPSPAAEAQMSSCKGDPGEPDVWSKSGCNLPGALGACKRMQGETCVAVWVKDPGVASFAAQAQQMCAAQGGTWVGY